MSLDDLPVELTARVVSYLAQLHAEPRSRFHTRPRTNTKPGLSRYAGASANLQHAIEHCQFSKLTLTSNDLATFEKLVSQSTSRRKAYLQRLTFTPILPAYNDNARARYERATDQLRNNKAFLAAIERLFAALLACGDAQGGCPIRLSLETSYAPTDLRYRDEVTRIAQGWDVQIGKRKDLSNTRFAHSYIRFDVPNDMPAVERITQFVVDGNGPRYVAPASILALLGKLPCVDDLTLSLSDDERRLPDLRKQLRIDSAKALRNGPSNVLRRLGLEYQHEGPCDQRSVNADVRGTWDDSGMDAFSIELHQFLSRCRKLTIVNLDGPICIDESFFWPPNTSDNNDQWASLEKLHIDLSPVRPDGGWYLDKDPDIPMEGPRIRAGFFESESDSEDDSDSDTVSSGYEEDSSSAQDELPPDHYDEFRDLLKNGDAYHSYFRSQPNEALERVLAAAAKAVARMPKLRSLTITLRFCPCPRTDERPEAFELLYNTIGSRNLDPEAGAAKLQLFAPNKWKMGESVHTLWGNLLGSFGIITYDYW